MQRNINSIKICAKIKKKEDARGNFLYVCCFYLYVEERIWG